MICKCAASLIFRVQDYTKTGLNLKCMPQNKHIAIRTREIESVVDYKHRPCDHSNESRFMNKEKEVLSLMPKSITHTKYATSHSTFETHFYVTKRPNVSRELALVLGFFSLPQHKQWMRLYTALDSLHGKNSRQRKYLIWVSKRQVISSIY